MTQRRSSKIKGLHSAVPEGSGKVASYWELRIGLATSSGDADCGCSAFQRMAAVMRVRPLG